MPKVRPASGVPTRITSTAEPLTNPIAAAGASGRRRSVVLKIGRERKTGGETDDERGDAAEPERRRCCEDEDPGRACDEGCRDERPCPIRRPAHQKPTRGPRDDSREEHQPADDAGDAPPVPLALEQRHDPVPCDDREPERGHLHRGERPETPVAEHAA